MYQPEAKYEFVRRYCSPKHGWIVFVDIDASELGDTGGKRIAPEAIEHQRRMKEEGSQAMSSLVALGATVRGSRRAWYANIAQKYPECGCVKVPGDRDIVAIHPEDRRLLVAEVEGASRGQPETKLYKAIGQIVMAVSESDPAGFDAVFVVVVFGDKIGPHLSRATALEPLGIRGIWLASDLECDRWLIGKTFLCSKSMG